MSREAEDAVSFSRWISRPQSLIALSAVVLSLCGLFIAVYEASLVRRQQRASVWPHVEVAASMTDDRIELWVQNVGVGPARVRAAAVSHDGEMRKDWADLIRRSGLDPTEVDWEKVDYYHSWIHGKVLPRDSEPETIFRVAVEQGAGAAALIEVLRSEILEGDLDVTLCYCSVYDECWTSSLRDVMRRGRELESPAAPTAIGDCEQAPRSGI